MTADPKDLERIVLSLRKDYLKSLHEKIQWLENSFSSMQVVNPQIQDEIKNQFHKWKGTGRTYGIPELTQIAQKTETHLKSPGPEYQSVIREALDELKKIHQQYSADI